MPGQSPPAREWIGGRRAAPFVVQHRDEPHRPDIVIWMELPDHLVVGQAVLSPGDNHGAVARTLRNAIVNPAVGGPRQPDAIRIADHNLADEQIPVVLDGADGPANLPAATVSPSLALPACCAQHRNSAGSSRTPIPSTARTGSCC